MTKGIHCILVAGLCALLLGTALAVLTPAPATASHPSGSSWSLVSGPAAGLEPPCLGSGNGGLGVQGDDDSPGETASSKDVLAASPQGAAETRHGSLLWQLLRSWLSNLTGARS